MNKYGTLKNKLNILSDEIDELHVLWEDDSYSQMTESLPKIEQAYEDMKQYLLKEILMIR